MAYDGSKLSLVYQPIEGARKHWQYVTADSLSTVLGAGYFSDGVARGMLLGDIVEVSSGTFAASSITVGETGEFTGLQSFLNCIVSAVSAGACTVIPLKKATVTDNSGGVANASTGVVAALAKYTALIPIQLLDLATGTWKLNIPHAFTVTSIGVRIGRPATTASKAATLTAQVNGTPVTGGVVSLTSANATPTGALVAGTAITALNTGTAAQTVEAAVSAVTTFVEGDGHIEFGITNNDLANAVATLIGF